MVEAPKFLFNPFAHIWHYQRVRKVGGTYADMNGTVCEVGSWYICCKQTIIKRRKMGKPCCKWELSVCDECARSCLQCSLENVLISLTFVAKGWNREDPIAFAKIFINTRENSWRIGLKCLYVRKKLIYSIPLRIPFFPVII